MDEVRVSPAVLKSAASAVEDLNAQAKQAIRDVTDETEYAAHALGDWRVGGVLADLMQSWGREDSAFARELVSLGDGLQKCATHYEHADAASAADFGAVA